ncbi:ATP-binding protein, partial [Streptomyces boncukensis]
LARTVQLVAADYLLTVNPVDGSEIEPCPPGERPGRPEKYRPHERPQAALAAGGTPGIPGDAGDAARSAPALPLLEREEERERLARLLARGRSVRLTGPAGSGRSALLDAVAVDVAHFAPDGVVRLSGHRRTPEDLLQELFAAVHHAPLHRPGHPELSEALARTGAVVLLDDLEFGGAALDELLRATPECAFLFAATPDVAAPSPDAHVEEVFLAGISRTACLELLEHGAGRPLTDEEADWAADLWFESEGLALRFVQAGALLRQQDCRAAVSTAGALPPLLAAGLSDAARAALRLALALDGALPHPSHLPALTGDPGAETAVAELVAAGLVTASGTHHRLAAGVAAQLDGSDVDHELPATALAAAQHYAWWAGQPSASPERAAAEAAPLLAAVRGAQRSGHESAAVLLARTAAPLLAAGLRWSAWERVLSAGQEAARACGDVAEEAYFHHELGVHALCTGHPERARAELDAALGLRGMLDDQRGVFAGRRALALVTDRLARRGDAVSTAATTAVVPPLAADSSDTARTLHGTEVTPPEAAEESEPPPATAPTALVSPTGPPVARSSHRRLALYASKRNVVAAGAGALLAAVLGTIVTVGNTSGDGGDPPDKVKPGHSASQDDDGDDLTADRPASGDEGGAQGTGGGATAPHEQRPAAGSSPSAGPDGSDGDGGERDGDGSHSDDPSDSGSGSHSRPGSEPGSGSASGSGSSSGSSSGSGSGSSSGGNGGSSSGTGGGSPSTPPDGPGESSGSSTGPTGSPSEPDDPPSSDPEDPGPTESNEAPSNSNPGPGTDSAPTRV